MQEICKASLNKIIILHKNVSNLYLVASSVFYCILTAIFILDWHDIFQDFERERSKKTRGKMSRFDLMLILTNQPRNVRHQYIYFHVKTRVKIEVKYRPFLMSALDRRG